MSSIPPAVPAPLPTDHEDVAWALTTAGAQWTSQSFRDAVRWVERAAETAEEVGAIRRSVELLQFAAALSRVVTDHDDHLATLRPVSAPDISAELEDDEPAASVEIEVSEEDYDDALEEDDEDEIALEMSDATEVVELEGDGSVMLLEGDFAPDEGDDDEPLPSFDYKEEGRDSDADDGGDRDTWRNRTPEPEPPTVRPAQYSSAPPPPPAPSEPPRRMHSSSPPPDVSSRPPLPSAPLPPRAAIPELEPLPLPRGLSSFKRSPGPSVSLGAKRSTAAEPRPAPEVALRGAPPVAPVEPAVDPLLEPPRQPEPSNAALESGGWIDPLVPGPLSRLDFDDEAPTRDQAAAVTPAPLSSRYPQSQAPSSRPPESFRATFPTEPGLDFDLSLPAEMAMSQRRGAAVEDRNELERELGIDLSLNFAPKRSAPAPASRMPKLKSSVPSPVLPEPFLTAPSATAPPTRPIEPPSKPLHAPPPDSMREPDADYARYDYPSEEEGPSGAMISAAPMRVVELPPPSSLDMPLAQGEMFGSQRPALASSRAPGPVDSLAPLRPYDTVVDGVHLLEVPGLGEFSKDALSMLMSSARQLRLNPGEEVNSFAAALVTRGTVQLMPTVADASCATVRKGGVIFSQGSVEPGIDLRVVGFDLGTRVVVFGRDEFQAALRMCPWVNDELKLAADSYQAMAGAVMGPLGESFDEMFRSMVLERLTVKSVAEGETLTKEGRPVEGLFVVGAGSLVVEGEKGRNAELGPGDFIFPETLLGGGAAPRTIRAASRALVLFAPRATVQELFATCPPFIELLAGA